MNVIHTYCICVAFRPIGMLSALSCVLISWAGHRGREGPYTPFLPGISYLCRTAQYIVYYFIVFSMCPDLKQSLYSLWLWNTRTHTQVVGLDHRSESATVGQLFICPSAGCSRSKVLRHTSSPRSLLIMYRTQDACSLVSGEEYRKVHRCSRVFN